LEIEMKGLIRMLVGAVSTTLVVALTVPGCGSDEGGGGGPPISGTGATGGGGGTGNTGAGVCLLNNCNSDAECEGCTFGRNKCNVAENRCIACETKADCKPGEQCTSFGTCAPETLTCPTDTNNEPTITCTQDTDCLACDPLHQVCDTASGKCKACKTDNTASCLGNQECNAQTGTCEDKCPTQCTQDSECSKCENGGKVAKACFNHVCAECSDTMPCGAGLECQQGSCVKPCGLAGSPTEGGGDCQQDAECYGCGNNSSTETWKCKFPINGGTHGTCVHPATGCTDLVSQGAVLPPPFDGVTNLCSTDANCSNVSLDYNVGQLIKDLVGDDELDLGLKKIKLNDAVIQYEMNACASIDIFDSPDGGSKKCGVCVPCNDDGDCKPIAIEPLLDDLFKGDALAQLASAYLLDLLFGKAEKHEIHMQCQNVAQGYGVCLPCANPLSACGTGSTGTVGSGQCEHDVCETGTALDPTCGLCAAAVCLDDFFCCAGAWDSLCVASVDQVCATTCSGETTCTHKPCEVGSAMHESCSPCIGKVCEEDPYCCNLENGQWDQTCADAASALVGVCAGECGTTGNCVHSECDVGSALTTGCSPCADSVCATDPFCCENEWDWICAKEAKDQPTCSCP
jgi:hypothetical protein